MTSYEYFTCVVSLVSLVISIATYIWTIKYRGKLEWHFESEPEAKGDYVCTIVNSGQKPITPLKIIANQKNGKSISLTPIEGKDAITKMLQPSEILKLHLQTTTDFMLILSESKNLVLVDSYNRKFPLDKKEFTAIQKYIKPKK